MTTVRRGYLPAASGEQPRNYHRLGGIAAITAVTLTGCVLAADSVVGLASHVYLNLVSGVWLALALDTYEGTFYRPLWDGYEYGGTRYFPMLPVATAALMKTGMPLIPAALTVSMTGLVGLAAGVLALLRRLAVPAPLAALGAALAVAPYFVHQTVFEGRSEPLAAAFAVAGLAVLAPLDGRPLSNRRTLLVAGLFACAFATKLTCVYAPAAAVVALFASRRPAAALKLGAATGAAAVLVLAATHIASDGRALESFRACALGGSTLGSLLTSALVTRSWTLIGTSRLLTALFGITLAALVFNPRRWLDMPALYLVMTAAITAVIFTSPGTMLANQILDAYVAAVVVLVWLTAASPGRQRTIGYAVLVAFAVWAAGQNIVRIGAMFRDDAIRASAEERSRLVAAVRTCGEPLVSESPLVPILAHQRPILLDPFAFHVVVQNRPEIGADLVARIARGEFTCIVLEHDPATPRGRAWYQNVFLSGPVAEAVLEHYRFDRTIAGQRFYVR